MVAKSIAKMYTHIHKPTDYKVYVSIIIIIIKLYLYTDKSGTAAPFTGVYTHYDKKNTLIIKVVKEKIYCEK